VSAAARQEPAVLVVDDDGDILSAISSALSSFGYSVFTAGSLEHGALALQTVRVDVLVSDWDLAGEDGAELLQFGADLQPHAARVLLTGSSPERWAHLVARGLAHVGVTKPVTLDDLIEALERACRLARR
jgi:DNA-binding NtrC family response regulator